MFALRLGILCYRTFGRPIALVIVHLIALYFFLTDGPGREASRSYLRRIHKLSGEQGEPPGLWQSFLHYRMFALSIFDRVEFWFGHADEFVFEFHGKEIFDRVLSEGRGAIIVGSHLGNFDAMRLLASRAGKVVNVLMFTDHAQRINLIFRELSPDVDLHVIRPDPSSIKTAFEVRSCLERGELVAILADRVEAGDRGDVHKTSFLGSAVGFPTSAFMLATLFGCPVMQMVGLRVDSRRYEITATLLSEGVKLSRGERRAHINSMVERFARTLEILCLRAPYQWFNYYDFWSDGASRDARVEEAT